MQKDERDLLDVLKFELEFLEKGGYGRSPRSPWRPQFIFEDSPTCMNYDAKDHPGPCSDCVLMQLVPTEFRGTEIPCRHIPFNGMGETLDTLYRYADQYETEETFGNWLREKIAKLEETRTARGESAAQPSAPGTAESKGEALFHNPHPKCANEACATAFHWLGGGKFYRFQPNAADREFNVETTLSLGGSHGVKHYWLCEGCSHVYSLAWDADQGVVLKLLRQELRRADAPKHMTAV